MKHNPLMRAFYGDDDVNDATYFYADDYNQYYSGNNAGIILYYTELSLY